jgi:hypothetical protein
MPHARAPRPLPPPPVPGRDDSPENLQRIRDELNDGFERLYHQMMAKRYVPRAASTAAE